MGGGGCGGAYTYLDMKTGHEFSATAGLTYNFMNPDTQYQNGVDFHLNRGASQFISKSVHIGSAGYQPQISPDSGLGAKLGTFEGRVVGSARRPDSCSGWATITAVTSTSAPTDLETKDRPERYGVVGAVRPFVCGRAEAADDAVDHKVAATRGARAGSAPAASAHVRLAIILLLILTVRRRRRQPAFHARPPGPTAFAPFP